MQLKALENTTTSSFSSIQYHTIYVVPHYHTTIQLHTVPQAHYTKQYRMYNMSYSVSQKAFVVIVILYLYGGLTRSYSSCVPCCPPADLYLPPSAPVTVRGDVHGQFYDLLELFRMGGRCLDTN